MDDIRTFEVRYDLTGCWYGVLYTPDGDFARGCTFADAADAADALCDIVAGDTVDGIFPYRAASPSHARGHTVAYIPIDEDGYNIDAPSFCNAGLRKLYEVHSFYSAYDADYRAWDATCY